MNKTQHSGPKPKVYKSLA